MAEFDPAAVWRRLDALSVSDSDQAKSLSKVLAEQERLETWAYRVEGRLTALEQTAKRRWWRRG